MGEIFERRNSVPESSSAPTVVYVVDDDLSVREALADLLSSRGMNVLTFATATEYLTHIRQDGAACLILDLQLPGIDGLELQERIAGRGSPPILFISGHGDVRSAVRAIKSGAVEFLTKPVHVPGLLAAIDAALVQDKHDRLVDKQAAIHRNGLASLTPREREVLPLVVDGLLNKQAAAVLGISEVTLQIHRGRIMRKMQAKSLAELVRIAAQLDIRRRRSRPDRKEDFP